MFLCKVPAHNFELLASSASNFIDTTSGLYALNDKTFLLESIEMFLYEVPVRNNQTADILHKQFLATISALYELNNKRIIWNVRNVLV